VRDTVAAIGDAGFAVAADVSSDADVRAYTDDTVARWARLDVAFNNAGVNLPTVFHEAPDDLIDRTIAVNLRGVIYGCRGAMTAQ
jgi:3-oxoacyl-[acyl-carrier protein] reductase